MFLSELVERDRGFMIMLILDVDFPLLAATANPNSVHLFSVLMCVFKREHNSVETALPLFVPLTEAPRGPGLSNWPDRSSRVCVTQQPAVIMQDNLSLPLSLSLLKLPPYVLFTLPPFLAGCKTRCSDSCSNDVVGGRVLLEWMGEETYTSTWEVSDDGEKLIPTDVYTP